jgi:iron complex outermembrane recepter protein
MAAMMRAHISKLLPPVLLFSFVSTPLHAEENAEDLDVEVETVSLEDDVVPPVVVTAPMMSDPYQVVTDPRQARLPLPAHDGGAYLKAIPGFTTSRKGGTSGDPALRGLGGSRLNILLDDAELYGGCGGRMDPPTAYVFPEAHDRIEIVKGPQSVRYGAAHAGVVRFVRSRPHFDALGVEGYASSTVGGFDRTDLMTDVAAGDRLGYIRLLATFSNQDDYRDGAGVPVHSRYNRWSATGLLGWTPDTRTHVELAYDRSDGQAAYDDRGMDGTVFDRTGYTLNLARQDLTPWLAGLEGTLFYNYVDHVMDNYRMRAPAMNTMVSYPDRRTAGGRLAADLVVHDTTLLTLGADYSEDRHRANQLMGDRVFSYREVPREPTAAFKGGGAFAEVEQELGSRGRAQMGLRVDRTVAEARSEGGFGGAEAGELWWGTRWSGFARYGHALDALPMMIFAGVGRSERAPDFWERRRVFDLETEKLTQIDLGASVATGRVSGNVALFHGWLDDYILVSQPGIEAAQARNVAATSHGAEADLTVRLMDTLTTTGTLMWVYGRNVSDGVPLAQTPPLEATLSLDYDARKAVGGVLLRAVGRQDRVHPGYGTIYSLDVGETPGFATVSAYGGYRITERLQAIAGVDNILDKTYAEHIQRGFAELGTGDRRINEPGRTFWMRLSTRF